MACQLYKLETRHILVFSADKINILINLFWDDYDVSFFSGSFFKAFKSHQI